MIQLAIEKLVLQYAMYLATPTMLEDATMTFGDCAPHLGPHTPVACVHWRVPASTPNMGT